MRSRVIKEDQAPAAGRWDFPAVDATAAEALRGAVKSGAHLLTAAQLDALELKVKEEARQRGFAEGLAAGKAEAAARVARLEALVASFAFPFQSLERAVEDEIVALATELARHLVRREIVHDPALLRAAIADCLAVLAANVRDVTLYLHPEDAALVASELASGAERCKIATDTKLGRGDIRIASATSLVDGSIAARCREIIAAACADGPPAS
jgi:flagellar assembly protein FliH